MGFVFICNRTYHASDPLMWLANKTIVFLFLILENTPLAVNYLECGISVFSVKLNILPNQIFGKIIS